MKGWDMFYAIKSLKEKGLKVTQVARILSFDIRTVKKYWDMTAEEFENLKNKNKRKYTKSRMSKYETVILKWLREFNDLSSSQIDDWLRANFEEFDMRERTVRAYVAKLREKYNIPKSTNQRQFLASIETEPGEQAQVDMGQIKLTTDTGKTKKVYLFAMVLSFSKYKFVTWQDRPFRTEDIIRAHHKAFNYFGGVPKTIVYDQDRTMFIRENSGDILKTQLFQKYLNTMNFQIYLCRKFDPQTKGLVESVVKYAKNNFAKNRIFTNTEDFNKECLEWLKRTGNAKEHGTTKKVPAEMFQVEQKHLQQVPPFLFEEELSTNIVPYSLAKDNTVTYKSNRYQLPKVTYSEKQKEVGLWCDEKEIRFFNLKTKDLIYSYNLSKERGKLISDIPRNKYLDDEALEVKNNILLFSENNEKVVKFLEKIELLKTRYIKEQFKRIHEFCSKYDKKTFVAAIEECLFKEEYNLDFLEKVLLKEEKLNPSFKKYLENKAALQLKDVTAETRDLAEYENKLVNLC